MSGPGDWTAGEPAIRYGRCRISGDVWYFRRGFCPACGSADVETRQASGRGTVYAATVVTRAPSDALRALAPYGILMVDAEEGFRLMAHGAPGLAIGDPVEARFEAFGAILIPVFHRRDS